MFGRCMCVCEKLRFLFSQISYPIFRAFSLLSSIASHLDDPGDAIQKSHIYSIFRYESCVLLTLMTSSSLRLFQPHRTPFYIRDLADMIQEREERVRSIEQRDEDIEGEKREREWEWMRECS